jgi:protein SCO1/2
MNQPTRLAAVAAIVLAAAAAGVLLSRGLYRQPPQLVQGTALPQPRDLPDVALLDQDGRALRSGDLRGHWSIVFFGFMSCPDVCPTTLGVLAQARRALSDLPAADQPAVLFVSVDPRRDTPARLQGYVSFFDPAFRGLTGTPVAIESLAGSLGAAISVGTPDADGNYTVDHTTALFVLNPAGQFVAVLTSPHTPQSVAGDFRRLLAATG